jgi:tRNA (adenine57-N1/adenine58-N1)-methyltransferase
MEQVLRTVAALNDASFTGKKRIYMYIFNHPAFRCLPSHVEITMYETLLRPHEVAQVPQLQPIGQVSENLKEAEKRREEKRLRQIANNKARQAAIAPTVPSPTEPESAPTKRKREDEDDCHTPSDLAPDGASPEPKRVKSDGEATHIITASVQMDVEDFDREMMVDESPIEVGDSSPVSKPRISVSNALPDVRGHTSYLTFAVLVPLSTLHVDPPSAIAEAVTSAPTVEPVTAPDASSTG